MLGKPGRTNPVFCMNVAGPWTFDFDDHRRAGTPCRRRSSARCGTRSLIHLPHSPCCLHAQGLFMHRARAALEQLDLAAGVERLAVPLDQLGLVVERVALAGRPRHEELHDPLGPAPDGAGRRSGPPRRRRRRRPAAARPEQVRQRDAAQAAAGLPEELATIRAGDAMFSPRNATFIRTSKSPGGKFST